MKTVPGWARACGIATAVLATPLLVLVVAVGAISAAVTVATTHRTASYTVGAAPRLELDAQLATVVVEAGAAGLIAIDEWYSAGTITRAGAGAAVGRMRLEGVQRGDEVSLRERSPLFEVTTTQWNAVLTVRVPAHTDLRLTTLGDVEIDRLDGRVNIGGAAGSVTLRDATLRGGSAIDSRLGDVSLERTTVAGGVTISTGIGGVRFDGALAPGGSSLSVRNGGGDVSVTLPRPTDARATVATHGGTLRADPAWRFVPDQLGAPRRWSADLGPSPTGTVTITTNIGNVEFGIR
jgi:hypothetical protein